MEASIQSSVSLNSSNANYSQEPKKVYNLDEFPELNDFMANEYNVKGTHNVDTLKISDSGELMKNDDDYMLLSYNAGDYHSNIEREKLFYDDFIRGFPEQKYTSKTISYQQLKKRKTFCPYQKDTPKKEDEFEQYVHETFRHIDPNIRTIENEALLWRFLKIIFDHPQRTSIEISAMCINQMFRKEFSSAMVEYDNTKKMKSTLQKFREHFSLLQEQYVTSSSTMSKHNNKMKMKTTLQKFRERFSLPQE